MKMISSTSNTSISGVTFMFAFWPPLEPTAIDITDLLYLRCLCYKAVLLPARMCRWSCDRWRGKGSSLLLIRQEAELVHPGRTNVVDDFNHPAELRPGVGFEKDPFIGPVRQLIFDL